MPLKEKTINGLIWSSIDNFSILGIQFVVSVVLARILTPQEFGIIGLMMVFIAISESFINSGFSQALIRKTNCNSIDYSTVFFFNLTIGILLYLLLFFSAGLISDFFDEPQLNSIVKVLSIVIIIEAITIIQRTILIKRVDFKLQTKISIVATTASGLLSIFLAYIGYGVWSLVALHVSRRSLNSLFLWLWNGWTPLFFFSKKSFKELFGFGGKLMISGLVDTIYRNIYTVIIGKYFSAQELGYYTRADEFKRIPSENLNSIIGRVSFPVLASMQNDITRLKRNYQKLIRSTMFIAFILMLGMAAVAEPMIITLIGVKWNQSIIYLQLLCIVGMMYPLQALNLNILQVVGRSDLFLKLEIIKKALTVPIIVIGVVSGIKIMIIGMIFNTFMIYFINSFWSGRLIGYSYKEQIVDILPSFLLALSMSILLILINLIFSFTPLFMLLTQVMVGGAFIVVFCEVVNFKDYIFIKMIFIEKWKNLQRN